MTEFGWRARLDSQGTTDLLHLWSRGSADAWPRLLDRVYPDLKRLASQRVRQRSLVIEPSDVVQELYLRLERQQGVHWADRQHFFALAARLVRRILVDQIRLSQRHKRGAGAEHRDVSEVEVARLADPEEILAVHQALDRLADESPSAARVVELRYFGGLTLDETAEVLGLARRTVVRRWRYARAWLFSLLDSRAPA